MEKTMRSKYSAQAIELMPKIAKDLGHDYIGPEHLLVALLSIEDCIAYKVISCLGHSPKIFRPIITEALPPTQPIGTAWLLSTPRLTEIIANANKLGEPDSDKLLMTHHLLISILTNLTNLPAQILLNYNITANQIQIVVEANQFVELM